MHKPSATPEVAEEIDPRPLMDRIIHQPWNPAFLISYPSTCPDQGRPGLTKMLDACRCLILSYTTKISRNFQLLYKIDVIFSKLYLKDGSYSKKNDILYILYIIFYIFYMCMVLGVLNINTAFLIMVRCIIIIIIIFFTPNNSPFLEMFWIEKALLTEQTHEHCTTKPLHLLPIFF